jgi:hypothetical protein
MQFAHDIHAYIAVHKPHLSYYIAIIATATDRSLKAQGAADESSDWGGTRRSGTGQPPGMRPDLTRQEPGSG